MVGIDSIQLGRPGAIPGGAWLAAILRRGSPASSAEPRRLGLLAAALLVAAVWAHALPAAAGGSIYSFVDEAGVTHFTNVPRGDKRYRKLEPARTSVRPASATPAYYGYDFLIGETARAQDVPPALIKAVIAAESAFDSTAVSRVGAQGLMQLMPRTAAELGVEDPFEPSQNMRGGASYLREMIDRYGDLARALAAYNAGPTAVDRFGGVPPYRETRAYVKRVLTYYRHYHGDFTR